MSRKLFFGGAGLLGLFSAFPVLAVSNVPIEFYPNYEIADEYEDMINLLVSIESSARVEGDPESIDYLELNELFEDIFEYFPSSPSNRILYEGCKSVTQTLSQQFEWPDYYVFKDRCFSPLNDLIKDINSNYTVKTDIVANPRGGPAPLNVTLDARKSIDPSQDTIPSENFFWHYKDVNGDDQPIGKGPVVNYTFPEPGRHVVHLTVRSANNFEQGIFDGAETVAVDVEPRAAILAVYVNGRRLTTDDILRLGTQEAKNGIYIDGTATSPVGQRTIVSHQWKIDGKQSQQFEFTRSGDGPPGQFLLRFPENGVYSVRLDLEDNQGNKLSETYEISVSDPVASIRFQPEEGTTSDMFTFDASASYSLSSRVATTQWIITDFEGNRVDTVETKVLKKKFSKPGIYTAKLTVTDELGNQSYDTEQFTVGSTPPVPSFTIEPVSDLEYPSKFLLDATPTYDLDASNNADALKYRWTFSSNDQVVISNQQEQGRKVVATFQSPGTFIARLLVEDAYGESVEIEKQIKVESTLRPELSIDPVVGQWGSPVQFVAKTNKQVAFYEWDFGDGVVERENSPVMQHTYKKTGVYPIRLTVLTEEGEENSLTRQVFIGQQDQPVLGYEVYRSRDIILTQGASCENASGEAVPAYEVIRYENMNIDLGLSRNVQGTQQGLAYQFHPQNDEVYNKKTLTYNFPLLGCTYMDVYVEDENKALTVSDRIWFSVENALPEMDNLIVDFPQPGGGNAIGVGLTEANTEPRDIFGDASIDPIVVRVSARGVKDPDGVVSHFIWYYYPSKDPERILGLKVTPGDVSYTNFVIAKPFSPTEYAFGVRMVDNDDGEVTSEELLGNGPLVFFPPGVNNLDIPIVTLKATPINAKVGDPVTFTAESNVLSEKPDFASARYYKYDFDGDGEVDLTTKKDTVQFAFSEPGEKYPKVQVYYRGRAGVGGSERIFVQKGVNPLFVYDTYDKKVLLKQMSKGSLEDEKICMDVRFCAEKPEWIIGDQKLFVFEYDDYGDYFPKQSVIDTFGNEASRRDRIHLEEAEPGSIGLMSIPQARTMSGQLEIAVGNSLDNTVAYYLDYPADTCFIDNDITVDSNQDGDPTADQDIPCNELTEYRYYPEGSKQHARVYYVQSDKLMEVDLLISFIDYEEIVNEEYRWAYEQIDELINGLDLDDASDVLKFYRDGLINLRASLGEKTEMGSLIIQLRQLLSTHPNIVSAEHKQKANTLFTSLSDSTVSSVFGGTIYDTAKTNVLGWFSPEVRSQAEQLFLEFERANGRQDEMKPILDQVFTLASQERSAGNIDDIDFVDIQGNLCDIVVYYELPSKTCGTLVEDEVDVEVPTVEKSKSVFWKILRIVLWVILGLAVVIGIIIVFFAIKAKKQASYVDEADDEDDIDEEPVETPAEKPQEEEKKVEENE